MTADTPSTAAAAPSRPCERAHPLPRAASRAGGALADRRVLTPLPFSLLRSAPPLRHSSLYSSNLMGTISNAIGAFVDMESFSVAGHSRLTGSLPASMSAWKKVEYFSVRGCKFDGVLPVLNYSVMKSCTPLDAGFMTSPPSPDFSCPFPQGVTEKCLKFTGSMEYRPVTNADCHNTTASE